MKNRALTSSTSIHRIRLPGVLRYPKFTVLWLSEAVSLIGDRILMVALIVLVYQQTQSAASVGLLSMIKALPALVLATIAGVFVDRWSHKWTMVIANLLQGLLVLLIPLTNSLPVILAVYLGMAVVNQFFFPARSATIPELVPKELILVANSLFAMGIVGAVVVGPSIGGLITDLYGLNMAFYVDSLTFFVPAIAVGCLSIPQTRRSSTRRALAGEWQEGLMLVRNNADVQAALLLIGVAFMQIASLAVLGIIILDQHLGIGAAGLGALMSFMGVGMLVGAIAQNYLKRYFPRTQLAACGAIIAGLGIVTLPWMPSLPLCMVCTCVLGLGFVTVQANAQTILQSAPEQLRGRALSMGQAVSGSITFLAAALMGVLANQIGTQATLMVSGLAAIITGVSIIWLKSQFKSKNNSE
jgi:predicted MFS family arabinose efflux permease